MDQYYQQRKANPFDDLKRFFRQSGVLSRLIIVNVGVWVLVQVVFVIGWAFKSPDLMTEQFVLDYFALPASFDLLILRPWTIITYMFLHVSFWHILFNMLWLYWFGRIFIQYLNERQILTTYILGGIAGGLLYILAFNLLPVFREALPLARALGASASVMAIVMAISLYIPNFALNLLFIGRVKIFYLALALFVIDFFMIRHGNSGGHIAHIGGALYGFIYVHYLRRGRDLSKMIPKFRFKRRKFVVKKKEGGSGSEVHQRPMTDDEYNRHRAENQKVIDHILDKISKSGYDSLTKEEKAILFKNSNKN